MIDFEQPVTRDAFLRFSVKAFALTSLTLSGVDCSDPLSIPALRGISAQEYRNMSAVGEVFLVGSPFAGFDPGKALDDYVYGHPYPLDTKDLVRELALAPSSYLAALVLDGSFTTLVSLNREEREKRLLGWKNSGDQMKMGLFNILRQTTFYLLSSSPEYAKFAGYDKSELLVPYAG